ncbi:hypothetical protein B0H15DRAFT_258042 [Mycena belliarum]|uniref:Uncharacterized protein n=1 Tax=Mycena belliarum TaxID=1033014 RepID=A0AAD6U9F7_9AGAR|nr:hypothetical protein B0H15DRAFT_258042 [Mycena belliae]
MNSVKSAVQEDEYRLSRSTRFRHMIDNKLAPFIPYPEDEKFPHDRYLSYFQGFQWTEDQRDPDDEVIQYETVRRLHMEYRFSAETIDDTLGDSHRRLRLSDESGLLWDSSQRSVVLCSDNPLTLCRDLPEVIWEDGNPFSSKPPLPLHFGQEFPAPNDIFSHINHGLKKFCPNLNCIMHNCQIHTLIRREPRVTSDELREEPGEPCGTECFRLMDPDDMEDQDMSMHNLDFLHGVLELDPDMLPCNLAVICKLPCRQISLYRRDLVDDSELFTPVPPRRMTLKKRKKRLTGRKRKRLIISHEKDKQCV